MRLVMIRIFAAILVFFLMCGLVIGINARAAAAEKVSSSSRAVRGEYTKLSGPQCKRVRVDREGGSSEQRCPGFAGYKLLVLDSDNRMSVTVIAPDGAQHPLELWSTVSSQFSELGKQAEWRIKEASAEALILPLKVNDDPNSAVATPYFVIVRLTGGEVCAVAKVGGGPNGLAEARRRSDSMTDASCLKEQQEPPH